VSGLETESSDQAIDGLANRVAMVPQVPIVPAGCDGQAGSAGMEDLEFQELGLDPRETVLVPNSLQNLAKNEIGHPQPLPLQFPIEPPRFRVLGAAQVIDPDGRVDDDHGSAFTLESGSCGID